MFIVVVVPDTVKLPDTNTPPPTVKSEVTVTSSGKPIVTVPLDLDTVVSLAVAFIPITAPVAESLRATAPPVTAKSPESKLATPLVVVDASSI